MAIALVSMNALVLVAVMSLLFALVRTRSELRGFVEESMSVEIRRQDDRIQKRLERAEGHEEEPARSPVYRIGQSVG